jgi:hypothetical protein
MTQYNKGAVKRYRQVWFGLVLWSAYKKFPNFLTIRFPAYIAIILLHAR